MNKRNSFMEPTETRPHREMVKDRPVRRSGLNLEHRHRQFRPALSGVARFHAGLSLVELLVGMALGLMVLTMLGYIYTGSRQSYRQQEAMATVQQNGRYALETLAQEARMAGYIGCPRLGSGASVAGEVVPVMCASADSWIGLGLPADPTPPYASCLDAAQDPTHPPTLGYDPPLNPVLNHVPPATGGKTSAGLAASRLRNTTGISNNVAADTDVLVIHKGANKGFMVSAMASLAGPVTITGSPRGLKSDQKDVLLISDCSAADIFHVASTSPTEPDEDDNPQITPNVALSKIYRSQDGAMVMGFESSVYFIRRVNLGQAESASNPRALFRARWGVDASDEAGNPDINLIAEHVRDMSVLFGVDDGTNGGTAGDGAADSYVTGAAIDADNLAAPNWDQVVSVRISLLLRSPDDGVQEQPQTYRFDTDKDGDLDTVTATDRRRYQIYTTTVSVRGRARG